MTERSELSVKVPFLDQVAEAIKNTGTFQKDLSPEELSEIMRGVVKGFLAGQDKVKARVSAMSVKIENERGTVAGSVEVEEPIKATISVNLTLGNDTRPNRLTVLDFDIQEEAAGFAAKLALKAIDIEGKAQEALRDPNQALEMVLGSQLKPKGVKLTRVQMLFKGNNALSAILEGFPLPRK